MDDIPYVIQIPQDYQVLTNYKKALEKLFANRQPPQIRTIIERIRDYYHVSLDKANKKKLQVFFSLLLQHLDKLNIFLLNDLLLETLNHYLEFSLSFPETINQLYKAKFTGLEALVNQKEKIPEVCKVLLNTCIQLAFLSLNTDFTNQFTFNFVLIVTQINKLVTADSESFLLKIVLLRIMTIMMKCSNLYNSIAINNLETVLTSVDNLPEEIEKEKFEQIFGKASDKTPKSCLLSGLIQSLKELIVLCKNDINFDVIFDKSLRLIQSKLLINKTLPEDLRQQFQEIAKSLTINIERAKGKKSVHINFFVEKRKEIESLNPEIEPEFDASLSWGVKKNLLKKKTQNSILKKVKKTKREAVRNLRKEARIIDMEKQKEKSLQDKRRKEDIKLSNQFIEQTNMEYKKLRTSQDQKKQKKRRETRKAGNQV